MIPYSIQYANPSDDVQDSNIHTLYDCMIILKKIN